MSVETPKATKPQVAMKAEVSYATSLTGDKTKIGYVQKVGQLKTLKEGQTYSALDLDEERMAKGKRKAETVDIEMMFIQEEHKAMGVIADADTEIYLFVKYPESTASVANKPLVQTVKCTIDIAGQEISDGDFIKDTMRVFKNSKVVETDGYPVEGDSTKF
jgi:hypothetical protein|nr:MAG TPA: hypothetical protein [Caudoviricetes sp.]